LALQTYDEDIERRNYLQSWCDINRFRTDAERAVAFAVHADSMRRKARGMRDERRDAVLAELVGALPIDDSAIAYELRDGLAAFHDRVIDRIWHAHADEFTIARCANCNRILKSPQARQCIWCGNDWHGTDS
jgi:hypothetical protein